MKKLLLAIAGAALLASPAFAFSKGVPAVQGTANGTPVPTNLAIDSTTGTLAASGDTVVLPLVQGASTCLVDIRGTYTGTVNFEVSTNGVDYDSMSSYSIPAGTSSFTSITIPGQFFGTCSGVAFWRVRASPWTSGTATVILRASNATARVFINGVQISGGPTGGGNLQVKTGSTVPTSADSAVVVTQRPEAAPICDSKANFSQTASAQLVATAAGQKIYICGVVLVTATAQNVSLVEGTGTTCATGIAGLIGGSAASMALSANGGFASVSGSPWISTATAGDELCLLQSGTGNVSGTISYRIQ